MTMPVVEANPTVRSAANEQQSKNLCHSVCGVCRWGYGSRGQHLTGRLRKTGRYNDLAATVIRNHRGQVIKTIGASIMAEFAHAADAVRAAVYLERVLTESAQEFSQCDQPGMRIGIHGLMGQPIASTFLEARYRSPPTSLSTHPWGRSSLLKKFATRYRNSPTSTFNGTEKYRSKDKTRTKTFSKSTGPPHPREFLRDMNPPSRWVPVEWASFTRLAIGRPAKLSR